MAPLLPSWRRSLAVRRISPRTIATYTIRVEQLADDLAANGMPTAVAGIRREHVEAFLEGLCVDCGLRVGARPGDTGAVTRITPRSSKSSTAIGQGVSV